MKTLNTVKQSSERIVAVGRDKLRAANRSRHRQSLLVELGQICLEDRSGTATDDMDADIDQLVARLLLLDEPWSDSAETVTVQNGSGDQADDAAVSEL